MPKSYRGSTRILINFIMQFYCIFMLRNKCSLSIHFGNVRSIPCWPCFMFLEFKREERGVKSFQKWEHGNFFFLHSLCLKNVFIATGTFIGILKAELHLTVITNYRNSSK